MKLKIALVIIAAMYISLFLHEMGHCLVFRHNGSAVEKVAVGTVWKAKLTIFTDSQGTKYELGPLPVWGHTQFQDDEEFSKLNLAQQAEIFLAGLAVTGLIVLFLTPWYFWLRRRWQKKGKDFSDVFLSKVFRVFITLNFLLLITNLLILLPITDGGQLSYIVLSQWLGGTTSLIMCCVLGLLTLVLIVRFGYIFLVIIEKTYGWPAWPKPRRRKTKSKEGQ